MADPKIRIKRSAVAGRIPSVDQVPLGELALNTWDGQLFASKNVGLGTTVVAINPWIVGTGTDSYNAYFTAGNIGIGITIPTSTLHVSGDGLFTSTLTATDSELYTEFDITNNGASAYQFASTGIGFTQNTDNPTLYLSRGKNYKFDVNASGHPFEIRSSLGGSAYNDGVVNNGAQVGVVTFKVPYDAPSLLYYQCTVHSGMNGKIYVIDAGVGPDVNVNTTGIITANSFVKSGGSSSEFLKADGSVDSNTYLTAESDTLDSVTGRGGVTSNNISVGMLTATAAVVGSAVTLNSGGVVAGLGTFNSFNTTQLSVTGISTLGHTIAGSAVTMTAGGIVAGLATVNYIDATHINAAGVVTATTFYGDGSNLTGISGGGSGVGYFVQNSTGIHTTSSVGIGTTTASGAAADPNNTTILNAGIVTANYFYGDGSGLTGIVAAGSGITVQDDGTNKGLVSIINFGNNLSVTDVSAGVVTVTSSGGGGGGGAGGFTATEFTATAGQTTFTVSYIPGSIEVYRNGIRLVDGDDYTATNGTSVVLVSAASDGDSIVVVESLALFGTNQTGIHTTSNLGIGTTSAYDALTVVGNANISGVITATTFYGDGSQLQGVVSGIGIALSSYNVGYAQTTIEFIGSGVTVVSIGNTAQVTIEPGLVGAAKSVTSFTATAGQTAFNVDHSTGQENVFLNGVRLSESQYTTNGSTITLNDAAADGDSVDVVVYLRGSDPNRNIEVNLRPPFNGITTAFTMYRGTSDTLFSPVDERQILVSLGGVIQQPGIAYTVGTGSSIFFSAAPGVAASCFITGLFSTQSGITTDATKIETQSYFPTGVQTSFTLTRGYEQNYLDVYVNGARLVSGQDYTATDSSTFSLTSPAQASDTVEAVAFRTVGITSAVTAGISSNVNGDYVNTTNLTVAGFSTFSDKIGIGTTSSGNNRLLTLSNPDDDCFLAVRSNITRDAGITFGDNDDGARGQVKYENNTDDLLFFTSGSERLRITSNGVGIGTTVPFKESLPSNYARLSVGIGTSSTYESLNVVGGSSDLNLANLKGGANLILENADPTDENFSLIRGRNVRGTTTSAIAFVNMNHYGTNEGNLVLGTRNSSGVFGERVRITGIGSVGIGTTRPIADLQVSGRVFIGDDYQDVIIGSQAPGDTATRHLDAQFTIGGTHNAGFNLQNKYKLYITGSDNDISENGVRTYPIYVEDENGGPLFNVQLNDTYRGVGIGTTRSRAGLTIQGDFDSSASFPVGDVCGIRIADQKTTATEGAGGGIIFAYTYNDNNHSPLNSGPFIKGYKTNSTSGDYGGGLSFGTRVNGSNQFERMRIQENGNIWVGLSTSAAGEKLHITFSNANSGTLFSTGNAVSYSGLKVENRDQSTGSYSGLFLRTGLADLKLACVPSSAGSNEADFVVIQDTSSSVVETMRYDISSDRLILRGDLYFDASSQSSPNATGVIYLPNKGSTDRVEVRNSATNTMLVRITDTGQIDTSGVYGNAVTGRDVYVSSGGEIGYLSSVGAAKTNIESLSDISWLYNLSPVSFNYRKKVPDTTFEFTNEYHEEKHYGLIAEEVEAVAPEVCFYDEVEEVGVGTTSALRGVSYSKLIAPLIKALQDANTRIEALEAQVSALQGS